MANEQGKAPTDADIQKIERAYGVLAGVFKGLKPDDITQVAAAFEEVGINLSKIKPKNMDAIVSAIEKMGDTKYGTSAAKNADQMIGSINKMLSQQKIKNNTFVSAYLKRTEIELRIAKLAKEKIAADEKGFFAKRQAFMKEQELKIAEWSKKTLGADSSLTKNILANAGWIGVIVGLMIMAKAAANKLNESMVSMAPGLAQTGLLLKSSTWAYTAAANELTHNLVKQAGADISLKQAKEMVNSAIRNEITSLSILAAQREGANVQEFAGKTRVNLLTQELALNFNRLSYGLTGSFESTNKFINIANKFGFASSDAAKKMVGSIANLSGTSMIELPIMMDLWDAVGDKVSALGNAADNSLGFFEPLIKNLQIFGKTSGMSNYALNNMTKGIVQMTKSTDVFMYMALKGAKGQSFSANLKSAIGKSPLERSMMVAKEMFQRLNTDIYTASVAMKDVLPGMDDATRVKFLEMMQNSKWDVKKYSGLTEEQQRQKIISDMGGLEGDAITKRAMGQLIVGGDLQQQMVDYLQKILTGIITGFAGLLRGVGQGNAARELDSLRSMSSEMNNKPAPIYSDINKSMMG